MPRATTGTQLKPKAAPERKPRQSRSKKAVAEHVDDDASSDVEAEPAEPAKRQQNRTKQVAKEGKSIQYAAFAKAIFELDPANIQQGRKLASLIAVDDEDAGVMEGSQFSTRAESLMYHQGGDLIGMTALAKAKLTRDAGIRRVFEQLDLFFQSTSSTAYFETTSDLLHCSSILLMLGGDESLGYSSSSKGLLVFIFGFPRKKHPLGRPSRPNKAASFLSDVCTVVNVDHDAPVISGLDSRRMAGTHRQNLRLSGTKWDTVETSD
ncbi:hypothetical protein B0H13DRAFT_1852357 [Mycena leptocephala]|nr:hypothetical protein B0H13DRAFT_1852357 [Mycena leptocephala]